MALVMCDLCKKAFFSSQSEKEICPECDERLRTLYPAVRSFIRNKEGDTYTAQEVSKALGVALRDVYALAAMGFVEYQEKANVFKEK